MNNEANLLGGMHEYKLQIDYTGHPATPWNVIVTHHGEKKIYEGSSQSLLFLLNQAGKLIREIEYAERRHLSQDGQ
jgi:hypothetical protein